MSRKYTSKVREEISHKAKEIARRRIEADQTLAEALGRPLQQRGDPGLETIQSTNQAQRKALDHCKAIRWELVELVRPWLQSHITKNPVRRQDITEDEYTELLLEAYLDAGRYDPDRHRASWTTRISLRKRHMIRRIREAESRRGINRRSGKTGLKYGPERKLPEPHFVDLESIHSEEWEGQETEEETIDYLIAQDTDPTRRPTALDLLIALEDENENCDIYSI